MYQGVFAAELEALNVCCSECLMCVAVSAAVCAAECVYRGDVAPAERDEPILDGLVDDVADEHDKQQEHKQRHTTCDTPHRNSVYIYVCI